MLLTFEDFPNITVQSPTARSSRRGSSARASSHIQQRRVSGAGRVLLKGVATPVDCPALDARARSSRSPGTDMSGNGSSHTGSTPSPSMVAPSSIVARSSVPLPTVLTLPARRHWTNGVCLRPRVTDFSPVALTAVAFTVPRARIGTLIVVSTPQDKICPLAASCCAAGGRSCALLAPAVCYFFLGDPTGHSNVESASFYGQLKPRLRITAGCALHWVQ